MYTCTVSNIEDRSIIARLVETTLAHACKMRASAYIHMDMYDTLHTHEASC